jgi:beta-phosphoglucomutase
MLLCFQTYSVSSNYIMHWIHDYQLFLFDFDGLLVNTEEIHFLAYKKMCAANGFVLDWNFDRYCKAAHYHPEALREEIYAYFPALKQKEPDWKILYAQKRQAVVSLVKEGAVHLMPGTYSLLESIKNANIKRCVVTHSPDELVYAIRQQHEILNTIPFWITREDYTHPKPDPECYIKAIERYSKPGEAVIGFEDSPRGIRALLGSSAKPVLICQVKYPEIPDFIAQGVAHFPSLEAIRDT